jgi:hypothetical protein
MDAVWIALIAIVTLTVLIMIAWPLLLRRFLRRYYDEKYQPQELSLDAVQGLPNEHHISGVPWITSQWQLSQSTSLQMIAAYYGVDYPRPYHDFLMGATYSANRLPEMGFSPLSSDPEIGMQVAAPYLGLARRYYVSDDWSTFCAALRTFLAQDQPLRLAVDMGVLYEQPEFIAHSIVLVGYDAGGFYYYESVARPPASVEAGSRPPGEKGLAVPEAVLERAVGGMSGVLKYPWRYALTVFEPAETEQDLRPVWTRNGNTLIEENKYGPRMGARLIEDLADEIVRDGKKFQVDTIQEGIELAAFVRQENAEFLRQVFPHDVDLLEAAESLEQAARSYRQALEDIQAGIGTQIEARRLAVRLREAAAAERKTGEVFLKRGLPPEKST